MRIIAGKYRRRVLRCPKDGTRPTLDRVRESLFAILGNIEGETVVDLYAGSGALGLEAASRGARHVVLVESDRHAAEVIEKNASSIGADQECRVVRCAVEKARGPLRASGPFDIVLADPPWKISSEAIVVVPEVMSELLAPGAVVVVGHVSSEVLELAEDCPLVIDDVRRWGDSAFTFLKQRQ